jgi:DNA-binding MarR family transcriptional regulator
MMYSMSAQVSRTGKNSGFWRQYHDDLFALGVTPGQARILLYIQQHPRCYLQQCARALGLTSRTVGFPVQVFQQKRWVKNGGLRRMTAM